MDVWIVAAVAGAGYVAHHCKHLVRDRSISSSAENSKFIRHGSSSSGRVLCDKECHLSKSIPRENPGESVPAENEQDSGDVFMAEVARTGDLVGKESEVLGNCDNCNVLSVSTLSSGFVGNEDRQENGKGSKTSVREAEISDDSLDRRPSFGETSFSCSFGRSRSLPRFRQTNGKFIKPISSLESCLMAQLYKDQAEMEKYILSLSSSARTPRPFIVTDENRIISTASGDFSNIQIKHPGSKLHKDTPPEEKTVSRVPTLINVGLLELPRKLSVQKLKEQGRKMNCLSKLVNGKQENSQGGPSHGMLFCLGISVGIISSFLACKREVDRLNELLKQNENLVQDLQEELEMKDSLTVKELISEDYDSQNTNNDLYENDGQHTIYLRQHGTTNDDTKQLNDLESVESCEPMSKIEAELEAELERLELNINTCSLEEKLSDLLELDPDFIPGITQGELKAELFSWQADDQPYADQDGSGTSTAPQSANYAVSPRELSLRLHELLQSKLEGRIKELEATLQNSQGKKFQYMESEPMITQEFSLEYSSIQGSPVTEEQKHEADDGLTKIAESEEEDLVRNNNREEGWNSFEQNLYSIARVGTIHCESHAATSNGNPSMVFTYEGEEHSKSSNDSISGDESDHVHDEMEELLIRQIVERTRNGSSVVLNAQSLLFATDEYYH